jgi:hypothetical protein
VLNSLHDVTALICQKEPLNEDRVAPQDITVVGRLPDGQPITFNHPAVQSACMFFGESLCLIPYFYMRWRRQRAKRRDPAYTPLPIEEKRSRRFARIMAFAVPTMCDATATTAMNLGLYYTCASQTDLIASKLLKQAAEQTLLQLQLFLCSAGKAACMSSSRGGEVEASTALKHQAACSRTQHATNLVLILAALGQQHHVHSLHR